MIPTYDRYRHVDMDRRRYREKWNRETTHADVTYGSYSQIVPGNEGQIERSLMMSFVNFCQFY